MVEVTNLVIPTLNGGRELCACLEAIRRQELDRPFEIICIERIVHINEFEFMFVCNFFNNVIVFLNIVVGIYIFLFGREWHCSFLVNERNTNY